VLAGAVFDRVERRLRPERLSRHHDELDRLAGPVADQVARLRSVAEGQLREHRKGIAERQFQQKRLADAVADVYGQIAVLSRVTSILEDQGVEPSGQERFIAETFCTRAARRVERNLDQIEANDDERMTAIAKLAYKRGAYGYAMSDD
jgi:acyl-CoA dehydrogenase family protein 9